MCSVNYVIENQCFKITKKGLSTYKNQLLCQKILFANKNSIYFKN